MYECMMYDTCTMYDSCPSDRHKNYQSQVTIPLL